MTEQRFDFSASRRAGVLLHPTSLPGGAGNGDLGIDAYRYVDFLAQSGISIWQMLPLGPTHGDKSPYQSLSVHAGNELLIGLSSLVDRNWLGSDMLRQPDAAEDPTEYRRRALREAMQGFHDRASGEERAEFERFKVEQSAWLDDYALYIALRSRYPGQSWVDWPQPLRDRLVKAMGTARQELRAEVEQVQFEQFLFFQQWHDLRAYARSRGVLLFGDMPIFVAHDSAEVWAHRDLFVLDDQGRMEVVAGVPPDYFSATGQRWGNPHYRWDRMQQDGFSWWIERLRTQMELFDVIRIDHFRGFEAHWEIPASEDTAINGHWVKAPGEALFKAIREHFGGLPLVAEDLGVITPEVDALRRGFDLPGMKILQFAFDGGSANPYLPHHHEALCVVYTGTHDNDTTVGWFAGLTEEQKNVALDYFGYPGEAMPWPMIRSALSSVAKLAVIPMQDLLSQGSEHRMNTPGTSNGNWSWRFSWDQLPHDLSPRLAHLNRLYGRN